MVDKSRGTEILEQTHDDISSPSMIYQCKFWYISSPGQRYQYQLKYTKSYTSTHFRFSQRPCETLVGDPRRPEFPTSSSL